LKRGDAVTLGPMLIIAVRAAPKMRETRRTAGRKPTGQFSVRIVPSRRSYKRAHKRPSVLATISSISAPVNSEKL
jgi:hypothetical protein